MGQNYNIYCDESGHLENDHQRAMVLGALWRPCSKKDEVFRQIRKIKANFNLNPKFEIKWTKVSPAKLDFCMTMINYFFNNIHLKFRTLIVPNKLVLNHATFAHDHDTWYSKIFFKIQMPSNGRHRYSFYTWQMSYNKLQVPMSKVK